jgi:hypothetical protein
MRPLWSYGVFDSSPRSKPPALTGLSLIFPAGELVSFIPWRGWPRIRRGAVELLGLRQQPDRNRTDSRLLAARW